MQKITEKVKNDDICWSTNELKVWVNAGLVKHELLEPEKFRELAQFISENKEKLHSVYCDNPAEYPCQVTIPAAHELANTYELQIFDKATGKVIKVLDRIENLELCEGLVLKVKAKEVETWRKKTENIKKLSDDQTNKLKTILEQFFESNKGIGIDELDQIIAKLISITKPSTYNVPQGLVDQKIHTREQISIQVERKPEITVHGIRGLSAGEHRIMKTLSLLIHLKKNGAQIQNMPDISNGKLLRNAMLENAYGYQPTILIIDEDEYYKAYWGDTSYGGSDKKMMERGLKEFSRKEFDINYQRAYIEKNKEKIDIIKFLSPMVETYEFYQGLTPEEADNLKRGNGRVRRSKRKKILIINQIFTDQIDKRFINFPLDINRRIGKAAGDSRAVTASMHIMLDYFLRDIANQRFENEIGEEKLVTLLELLKMKNEGRELRLKEHIKKCFDAMKNIGVLVEIEILRSKDGSYKYRYSLNKQFKW